MGLSRIFDRGKRYILAGSRMATGSNQDLESLYQFHTICGMKALFLREVLAVANEHGGPSRLNPVDNIAVKACGHGYRLYSADNG
jgi:hypothetical protein